MSRLASSLKVAERIEIVREYTARWFRDEAKGDAKKLFEECKY